MRITESYELEKTLEIAKADTQFPDDEHQVLLNKWLIKVLESLNDKIQVPTQSSDGFHHSFH